MLIQNGCSAGGWELVCVLVRKDVMAPIWRSICIGVRKNALPVTTIDCNSQKGNQGGMPVLRATGEHQEGQHQGHNSSQLKFEESK